MPTPMPTPMPTHMHFSCKFPSDSLRHWHRHGVGIAIGIAIAIAIGMAIAIAIPNAYTDLGSNATVVTPAHYNGWCGGRGGPGGGGLSRRVLIERAQSKRPSEGQQIPRRARTWYTYATLAL